MLRGHAASPVSPSRKSMEVRRDLCSTNRWTASRCSGPPWLRAGSPSSSSSAADCRKCSGRPWDEGRPHCGHRGRRLDRESAGTPETAERPVEQHTRLRAGALQERRGTGGGAGDARAIPRQDLSRRDSAHLGGGRGRHRHPHARQRESHNPNELALSGRSRLPCERPSCLPRRVSAPRFTSCPWTTRRRRTPICAPGVLIWPSSRAGSSS